MFFIGIFGIEFKEKIIKILNNISCQKCNFNQGKLIKTFNFFHFFFIPLFKWNEKYYVQCEECNALYEISKEKGKAIESNEDMNITYWDLKLISHGNIKEGKNYCPYCGEDLNEGFKYCPYCGKGLD